jgi:hypothetical protein
MVHLVAFPDDARLFTTLSWDASPKATRHAYSAHRFPKSVAHTEPGQRFAGRVRGVRQELAEGRRCRGKNPRQHPRAVAPWSRPPTSGGATCAS